MSSIEKAMERQSLKGNVPANHGNLPQESLKKDTKRQILSSEKNNLHINISKLEQDGLLIPEYGGHCLAEEYRMLKRPLLINAFGKGAALIHNGNLVMIVSALSGEGKTFTTLNLSMSIAVERDTTVLIVDSDVIKPSLSQALGVEDRLGLTDLLKDDSYDLGDVIVSTDIPKLKVLPVGKTNTYSTELLSSLRMERLAIELSERYQDRVILFDAPPLMVTTQACALAHQMGQILVVVEAGKTSQSIVKEALSLLDTKKAIGLILNKKPNSFIGGKYSHYGYEYGNLERNR